MKRAGNALEPEILDSVHTWIQSYLVPNQMLSTLSHNKFVCHDITLLVQTLFSVRYMVTFTNTRYPLQIALFLTLLIDYAGRVSEFIAHGKIRYRQKMLRWCHTSFYAFCTPGGIVLKASVRFNDLKNTVFDPSKHKTIPLRFLPLELAAEDSLRLLITVAFIDRVFENLHSWEDIQNLNPGPDGTLVRIKESALLLPVCYSMIQHGTNYQMMKAF